MAIYKIRKRNGTIVTFDRLRIEVALEKAIQSVGGNDFSQVAGFTDEIISIADTRYKVELPSVENIQDIAEEVLIKHEHDQVAKAYILYREKRTEARTDQSVMLEVGKTMDEYLDRSDWRVNANANSGYSLG